MSQSDALETLMTVAAAESVTTHMAGPACGNCGAGLTGRYCAACGQSITDRSKSLVRVAGDLLQDFVHFDSRVLRTLAMLLFMPGKMTRQFIEGRRVSFVPPLRLYLFSSLIFFLILSLANVALFVIDLVEKEKAPAPAELEDVVREATGRMRAGGPGPEDIARLEAEMRGLAEAHKPTRVAVGGESFILPPGIDMQVRFLVDLDVWTPNASASRFARMQAGALLPELGGLAPHRGGPAAEEGTGTEPALVDPDIPQGLDWLFGKGWAQRLVRGVAVSLDHPENLNKIMGDNLAKAMFVLMPIYALLLGIVHVRRRLYLVDHLTFALHLHAFLFVFLTIIVLIQGLAPGLMLVMTTLSGAQALFGTVALYSWIAMRWAYGQGVVKTTIKWIMVGSVYSILLLVALVTALLLSLPSV